MRKFFVFAFLAAMGFAGTAFAQFGPSNHAQPIENYFTPPGCKPGQNCTPVAVEVYIGPAPAFPVPPAVSPTPTYPPGTNTPTPVPTSTPNGAVTTMLLTQASQTPTPVYAAPGVGNYMPIRVLASNSSSTDGDIVINQGSKSISIHCPADGVGYDGVLPDFYGNQAVSVIPPSEAATVNLTIWELGQPWPSQTLK
jgi:hypothetical protein